MANKKSWVIIGFILLISLSVFGYYWNQVRAEPTEKLFMETLSLRLVEITAKGPILWGQALFVLAGLVVFLYALGATFVVGEKKLIFPLLVLAIGLGYATIIEPVFGVVNLWTIPLVLILSIFIAVYWITQLFPKR